jgi:hypothetical protein
MPVVQGAFNLLLRPGARRAYADEYEQLPLIYPAVLPVETSQRAIEEWIITTGLGTMPEKPEASEVALDKPRQIAKVKVVHTSYGIGFEVSHEMMINDLYDVVSTPSARFLAQSQRDTEERVAHAIFNNAFTTVQAYDGVSLCNSAHVLSDGTTLANRPSPDQALSVAAIQAAFERFRNLRTERGLRIRMRPEVLFVPPQLEWRAKELLRSQFKPFTANNEINPIADLGLRIESSEYLTSPTAWFLLAGKQRLRIFFIWRERPNLRDTFNEKTRVATFMNFSIFSTAVIDYRGIDGSTG